MDSIFAVPDHPPLMKVFEGILASQSFDLVESFASEDLWQSLLPQEKELLAQLFIIHGERLNSEPDAFTRVLHSFHSATLLTPHKAAVWFKLGSQLALCDTVEELIRSRDALERSIALDDGFFDAWYTLANVYVRLALKQSSDEFLLRSHEVFEKGSCQFEKTTSTTDVACPPPFYWHWGLSWFLFARFSGEPSDLQHALTLYKKALNAGLVRPDFFNDYGNALVEFAMLTSQPNMVEQAIILYEQSLNSDSFESLTTAERAVHYFNLGCCYQQRFEQTYDSELFDKITHLYSKAAELNPSMATVWFKWGQLLFTAARFWQNIDLLEGAISNFEMAQALGNDHPILASLWAESLTHFAIIHDRIDHLATALFRAEQALSHGEQYPDCWHAYIFILFEIGRTLGDSEYYERARAAVENGLVLHPKSAMLWRLLGVLKGAQGDEKQSTQLMSESLLCFHLAGQSALQNQPGFWNDWGVVLMNLAEALQDERLAVEAIEKFEKAIELSEDPDPVWLFNCGWTFNILGECTENEEKQEAYFEKAVWCFDEVFQQDPDLIEARLYSAQSMIQLALLKEAYDVLLLAAHKIEEYIEVEYESEDAFEDLVLIHLNLIEFEFKDAYVQRCQSALDQLRALGCQRVHFYSACLHAMIGAYSDAFQDLEDAFELQVIPSAAEIEAELWLMPIHQFPQYQALLERVRLLNQSMAIGEQLGEGTEEPQNDDVQKPTSDEMS